MSTATKQLKTEHLPPDVFDTVIKNRTLKCVSVMKYQKKLKWVKMAKKQHEISNIHVKMYCKYP